MDHKFLTDAILGNRPDLFESIWPVYKKFLESTDAGKQIEVYFLDRSRLINDFFRWLKQSGHEQELALIDRRSGADRRGGTRPDAPGRRQSDLEKAVPSPFAQKALGDL